MGVATLINPILLARDIVKEFEGCTDILQILIHKHNIILEMWNTIDKISGTLVVADDYTVIGVNQNHPKTRQRFTIAHELGHFLLGHGPAMCSDESIMQDKNKEFHANYFAAELLMPRESVIEMIEYGLSAELMAESFGVSMDAMRLRLRRLKLDLLAECFATY